MKKKLTNLLKYIFFLGIGVFLVWWSLHQVPDKEWDRFKLSLANAHYWLFLPVFLILTLSHFVRALRWKILMEPMGYNPSLTNSFFAVMIGYLANLAFPRLGEVLKCTILAKYEKIPAEKIVGTIVAERAFDMVCLAIVFLFALFFQFNVVTQSFQHVHDKAIVQHDDGSGKTKLIIFAILIIAAIVSVVWFALSDKHKAIIEKVKKIILGVWEGLISAKDLKHKGTFVFYSASIWILYAMGTWIGLYATDGTGLGIKGAISCLAFASIGMILTPGGIGAYAYLIAKVLEQNGVDYTLGIANGTLQWFAQCIIVLSIGFTCMGLLPWYNKKREMEAIKH